MRISIRIATSAALLICLGTSVQAQYRDHTWNPDAPPEMTFPAMPSLTMGAAGEGVVVPPKPTGGARWSWGETGVQRCGCSTGMLGNANNYWSDWLQKQYCTGDGCTKPFRWCYSNYEIDPYPRSQHPSYNIGRTYPAEASEASCPYEMPAGTFPYAFPKPNFTKAVGWDGVWRMPDGSVSPVQRNYE